MTETKKSVSMSSAWREAQALVWAHRRRLAFGMVLMVISRMASLVLPATSKYLIDDVIVNQRAEMLPLLAAAVAGAALVQAASSFGLTLLLGVAAQRAITDMRKRVEAHILHLPVRYFDSTQSGILVSRVMSDADGIRNLVGSGLVQLVGGAMTAIVALGVLFYLSWELTSIIILILATFGGVMAFAFTRLRPLFRERRKIAGEVSGRLTESLSGIRIVKTYVAEKREEFVFARGVHTLFRNVAKTMTGVSAMSAFSSIVIGAVGVLMITLGGRFILDGSMTLGDLIMFIFFTGMVAMPVVQIASIGTLLSEAFAGLDRIREVLGMDTEDVGDADRQPLDDAVGDIVFEHVSFAYTEDTPVLRDVSFVAPSGTTTALVGPSGSGKSTLISLVMAFNRPTEGIVRIDGHDLRNVRLRDYRLHLGVVLQDNFLFDGTLADNIRYGKPGASDDDIRRVSRIAHCAEFIEGFTDGYQTIVGERGVRLSGGQRQRVAIARAILADPKILILDEATSSLDSESEALIQDGLRSLRRGRTTFVIAHRLSTIRSADQILVIEDGAVTERGTHETLLALDGRYRQLHDRQYQIESNRFINPGEDFTEEPERVTPATTVGDGRL